MSAAELFVRHAQSDEIGAPFEERSVTYRELAAAALERAALWMSRRDPQQPRHIGVLLDNTPEYLFWLGAAAISRSVIVGINSTYRGEELAQLIDHTECQIVITSSTYSAILHDAPHGVPYERILDYGSDEYSRPKDAAGLLGRDDSEQGVRIPTRIY